MSRARLELAGGVGMVTQAKSKIKPLFWTIIFMYFLTFTRRKRVNSPGFVSLASSCLADNEVAIFTKLFAHITTFVPWFRF